jgi:isoaspartyl peptidase/L-asparaginase-like protein (Ntn-hydrolase superfamily)
MTDGFALAVHGGAGAFRRDAMSAARGALHHAGPARAPVAGRDGELALPFNCSGMYRGYVKSDGIVYTAIYNEAYRSA